jgi:hypothetical protein
MSGKELAARGGDSGPIFPAVFSRGVSRLVAFTERKCKPHNYLAHLGHA